MFYKSKLSCQKCAHTSARMTCNHGLMPAKRSDFMKTSICVLSKTRAKTIPNTPTLLWLAPLVLLLTLAQVQASPPQIVDLSGTTPDAPPAGNPALVAPNGANATAQTTNPNNPPSTSIAKAQSGGSGGDSTAATAGGKGGKGGKATAIAKSNVPGAVMATAVGGDGGFGGEGSPGGSGGDGGDALAEALGMSTSASAEALGGGGGMGLSSTPRGGASGNGGNGGNAQATIDVQQAGGMVAAIAKGGAGGGGGLGLGGGTKGVTGNGGNSSISANVMATGANDITINLLSTGGRGGMLGGTATTTLTGSTANSSAILNITNIGGSSSKQSGDSKTKIDFTAQKNLTIDSKTSVISVNNQPNGVGGAASTVANLTSQTGDVTGKITVQGGPIVNSPNGGVGGNASGNVTATAAGNINLEEFVRAGWGGGGGGTQYDAVLTGTSPNGNVVLVAGAVSGNGSKGASAKATGTGKTGSVEAISGAGPLGETKSNGIAGGRRQSRHCRIKLPSWHRRVGARHGFSLQPGPPRRPHTGDYRPDRLAGDLHRHRQSVGRRRFP